jgi:hypothetical protein
MAILWFGGASSLEDLKVEDLERERLVQEVQRDRAVSRIRRAQDEHDGHLDAGSEPGLSDAELDVSAYEMDLALKRKAQAESDLQQILTRMGVLDATKDILNRKSELQENGIWKTINEMDEERLGQQLEQFSVERKEGDLRLTRIQEMMQADTVSVRANRTPGFRRSRAALEEARDSKQRDR